MGLSEKEKYEEDMNTFCRACSDPLFINDYFLKDGHSEKTPNATATFIKYDGRYYACTCRHVLEEVDRRKSEPDGNQITLSLRTDKAVINLSFFLVDGLQSAFSTPEGELANEKIDIGLTDISSLWSVLEKHKNKVAIDLDRWEEAPWDKISMCAAAGYATEHKELSGDYVRTPMPLAIAELRSTIKADTRQFTLSSTLAEPHGIYFSGTSGGPILGCWDEAFTPVGLIFEGYPSSRKQEKQELSFLGLNDIFIRGLLLTPDRFAEWLDNAEVTKPT